VGTTWVRRTGAVAGIGIGALMGFAVPAEAQTPSPFPSSVEMCYATGGPVTSTVPLPTVPGTPTRPPAATIPCHLLEDAGGSFPWGAVLKVLAVPALLVSTGIRAMMSRR
jgi:hypothetical protein